MKIIWFCLFATIVGCANKPCIGKDPRELKRIFVARADGTKQCQPKSGTKLDDVVKEVGVRVFSKETQKSSGVMIQLCGAPTGNLHILEIREIDLDAVTPKGFVVFQK